MIYLYKILPVFVLPVGITLLLVLAGLRLRRRALIWSGMAVLWLSSTPFISGLAVRTAEAPVLHAMPSPRGSSGAFLRLLSLRSVGSYCLKVWN